MSEGFDRRRWLGGMLAGVLGALGLRRVAAAAPAPPPILPAPALVHWQTNPGELGYVTTCVYDATDGLVPRFGQVTTYTYSTYLGGDGVPVDLRPDAPPPTPGGTPPADA